MTTTRLGFCVLLLMLASQVFGDDFQKQGLEGVQILPSATDPRIKTFNTPHFIYVDRRILIEHEARLPKDRNELLVFIPGTKGKGRGPVPFLRLAALQGYHVISLMYPDDVPAANFRKSSDSEVFEKFRNAIIYGGTFEDITIEKHDSIESRLLMLLLHLAKSRPREHWEQFLTRKGEIAWGKIALAGQSQGGGHAALLAKQHEVLRVICTGSPKDYNVTLDKPAAWYQKPFATPLERFYTFNHLQDNQGCNPDQCEQNIRALGLLNFSGIVNVDGVKPPYRGHVFVTNTIKNVSDSKTAHTSVLHNQEEFEPLWLYFLTTN